MAMTKKNYEAMATEFGTYLNYLQISSNMVTSGNNANVINKCRNDAYWSAINSFIMIARIDNPRFETTRFLNWIDEVRTGVRDLNGKKVTKAKLADFLTVEQA